MATVRPVFIRILRTQVVCFRYLYYIAQRCSAGGQLQYLLVPGVQVVQAVRPGHHGLQVSGHTYCQCHYHFGGRGVV